MLTVAMAIVVAAAVPAGALADTGGAAPGGDVVHASAAKKKAKKKKRCAKRKHVRHHRRCAKPRRGGPLPGGNPGDPGKGGPSTDPGTGGGPSTGGTWLSGDAAKAQITRVLSGSRYTYCNFVTCAPGQGIYEARLHFCDGGRFVYEAHSGQQRLTGTWSVGSGDWNSTGRYSAPIDARADDGTDLPLSILENPETTRITYFQRLSGGGVDVIEIIPELIERNVPCGP
jgi:hypothetical protein